MDEDDFGETKVPLNWTDDGTETTVEQWGQRQYDSGQRNGIELGIGIAANHVVQASAALFMEGNDKDAQLLRRLAAEIKKRADDI